MASKRTIGRFDDKLFLKDLMAIVEADRKDGVTQLQMALDSGVGAGSLSRILRGSLGVSMDKFAKLTKWAGNKLEPTKYLK